MNYEKRLQKSKDLLKILEAGQQMQLEKGIGNRMKIMLMEFFQMFDCRDIKHLEFIQKVDGEDDYMINELCIIMNSYIDEIDLRLNSKIIESIS